MINVNSKQKDIYVLGTGLSHDGSACLLKDGEVRVAIEKERITRIKHDGFNDTDAINYCLQAEGITINDVSLVVQNANFSSFDFGNSYFFGDRLFHNLEQIPVITISHHLAHAYYAIGTCPFEETAILVMDGCGSLYEDCIDLINVPGLPQHVPTDMQHLFAEKDSLYHYKGGKYSSIYKDFSPWGYFLKKYPMHPNTIQHSIGGLYSAVTSYCFQNDSDSGKLMGLAPYGRPGIYTENVFNLDHGRVFVDYNWMRKFNSPARSEEQFWKNFQYYADIAYWIQKETEKAILYVVQSRRKLVKNVDNLSYTGGVALNAVANAKIIETGGFKNYYFTPAAGDNGLAIGCAFYGWLEVLKKTKSYHKNDSCYGKIYSHHQIKNDIENFILRDYDSCKFSIKIFFDNIHSFVRQDKVIKEKYVISIVLSDLKIYILQINKKGELKLLEKATVTPDCTLVTDMATFLSALVDQSYLITSIKDKKSMLTGDLSYFLSVININDLVMLVKKIEQRNENKKTILFTEERDVVKKSAELLAEGKIIGWFQGGCEFGPRALGHRSILADPRRPDVQKFINDKIKFREDFRPFAPSVLREKVSEHFEYESDSPFMLIITQVKEQWKDKIPGVVHSDNSARIQTVSEENDKRYYQLIKEFEAITNIPVLLNTSFNKRGMPIVETPVQAITYFFECELDCLVIGDFIIHKN